MFFGLRDGTTPDKHGWLERACRAGLLLQERLKPLLQKSTASSLGVVDRERQRRHHAALLARHHADLPVVQASPPAHDRQSVAAAQPLFGVGTAVPAFEHACGVILRTDRADVDTTTPCIAPEPAHPPRSGGTTAL